MARSMDDGERGEMVVFWFLLIALVAVVAVVTLAVVGGGDGGALRAAEPERLYDPLPADRPCTRADVAEVRLPPALRGYRMNDVDDVLDRLGAELAERDARIAELEAALAGANAAAMSGGPGLMADASPEAPDAVPGAPDARAAAPDAGPAASDARPASPDTEPDAALDLRKPARPGETETPEDGETA